MEQLLSSFAEPNGDPVDLFARLIDQIRPRRLDRRRIGAAQSAGALPHPGAQPGVRRAVRRKLGELSATHRHSDLYTSTGILPNTGFVSECLRRVGHKILPEVLDGDLLRSTLRRVFHRCARRAVGDRRRRGCLAATDRRAALRRTGAKRRDAAAAERMLRSLRIISYWIAASAWNPNCCASTARSKPTTRPSSRRTRN
jgi:hypothetical protein